MLCEIWENMYTVYMICNWYYIISYTTYKYKIYIYTYTDYSMYTYNIMVYKYEMMLLQYHVIWTKTYMFVI